MAKEKAAGPLILVDAGDALVVQRPVSLDEKTRPVAQARAEFLLRQLAAQGYSALAVGERELVWPTAELVKKAAEVKLTLLAANLVDAQGKHPFQARTMVTCGGRKVGLFAVVEAPEYEAAGLKVTLPAEAAQAQADALRKEGAELVVGLLHMNYDAALKLAEALKGVDYAVQSHVGRPVTCQPLKATFLAGGGMRGQQIGRAVFDLQGKGPLFDVGEAARARAQLADQERQLATVTEQLKKATDQERPRQQALLDAVRHRRDELKSKAEAKSPAGRRTVRTDPIALDASVPDDPAVKKEQDALQAAAPAPK